MIGRDERFDFRKVPRLLKAVDDLASHFEVPAWAQELRKEIRECRSELSVQRQQRTAVPAADLLTIQDEFAKLRATQAKDIEKIVRETMEGGHKSRWSAAPLSEKIKEYIKAKVRGNRNTGKHVQDVETRLQMFLRFVGDIPARELGVSHIQGYRDLCDSLSERWITRFQTEDWQTAIDMNKGRKKPVALTSATTINLKYLGPVSRLCRWLAIEAIEKDISKGIQSKRTREEREAEGVGEKRYPFKISQINSIFATTSQASRATALYWLPLLMLFTGARLNELAQLRVGDLRLNYNGRPHLSMLCRAT